jgi:ATP-dependent Lon protease
MIQIGGSSNGSLLHGHNYTYVSSTWGCLVQILMDSKVMNPIIFIDEVDKISKTENGKEIIHILIHLLDSTQNTQFQDKYFSGIPLDFSKVLFILSYNDPSQIDKILLDRIHRIKFKSLKLNEKIEISKQFILPQIYSTMGLNDNVLLTDDIIEYIVETYTDEPGVRKLKELFFELIGNINLKYLENNYTTHIDLPIIITKEDIDTYFKNKYKIIYQTISDTNTIGRVYGLWVNQENKGGILPIQISYFPSKSMNEFKLTGKQGDVMKESMNVSLSLILNMLSYTRRDCIETNGIHIHCPEGATPKNGPSAGLAITCALYSLLENKIIPSSFAMTGEISLDGTILPIGGLEYKILGGIKAGVKTFFYPKENERDIKEKQENICYCPFNNIVEVLQYLSNL